MIDRALTVKPESPPADAKPEPAATNAYDRLGATQIYLAEGRLEIGGQVVPLDAPALEALKTLLNRLGIGLGRAAGELHIQVTLKEKQA